MKKEEKEIKEFVRELEKLWLKYPTFRFGQLLFNCTSFGTRGKERRTIVDPFYYEDEMILNEIKLRLNKK